MHEALVAAPALGSAALLATRALWLRRPPRGPLQVGDRAPRFEPLPCADGRRVGARDLKGAPAVVLVFMSNACPGVKAYDARLRDLHATFAPAGVRFLGANPVDDGLYPNEGLDGMARAARERRLSFPYLKDEDQRVAQAFGAVCTPHVFVMDAKWRLRYRGRIDDAMVEGRAKRRYLRDALDAVTTGRPVLLGETAPLGCAIEYAFHARAAR